MGRQDNGFSAYGLPLFSPQPSTAHAAASRISAPLARHAGGPTALPSAKGEPWRGGAGGGGWSLHGHARSSSGSSFAAGRLPLLRLLGSCCLVLLVVSLLYTQLVSAGGAARSSVRAAAAEGAFATAAAAAARGSGSTGSTGSTAAPHAAAAGAAPGATLGHNAQQQQASAATPASSSGGGGGSFPAPQLQHLVLVAGHAVFTGLDFAVAAKESSWFLEPYQRVAGEAQSFLDHIRLGIQAAARDPAALLLFSGGQTRKAAGPRSEGLSYWMAAEAAGWFGARQVRARAYTEEHARDSFENLLFSLCRFYELTGHYPARITAVSYSLKQQRFEGLHRAAVRFPAAAFHFIGTPVPPAAKGAAAGEAATVAAFQRDPYGCAGSLLAKRARRDPFALGAMHPSRCPAMAALLQHCGPKAFAGPLPWDGAVAGQGAQHEARSSAQQLKGRRSSRAGIYT